jgi:hypothetical protein
MVPDNAAGSRGVPQWVVAGQSAPDRQGEAAIALATETACELTSNARRRAVLGHVAALDGNESVGMGTLARRIAGEEHDIAPAAVSSEQRKTVYVSLLQNHLPKLDDAGVVAWDDRSGEVARGHSIDALASLVDGIERACVPTTPASEADTGIETEAGASPRT